MIGICRKSVNAIILTNLLLKFNSKNAKTQKCYNFNKLSIFECCFISKSDKNLFLLYNLKNSGSLFSYTE